MKAVFAGLMAGLFLTVCVGGCRHRNTAAQSSQNGIIDFRLDTLGHERFYLNQYRGKVVVLAFWATWCGPCKTELVELKSLAAIPGYADVMVAAVCTDPENIGDVKSVVETLGLGYPVLLDKGAKVFTDLKLSAVPTTLVIDRSGRVNLTRLGFDVAVRQQIEKSIERLLTAEDGS